MNHMNILCYRADARDPAIVSAEANRSGNRMCTDGSVVGFYWRRNGPRTLNVILAYAAIMLAGCGGGGGDSPSPNPTPTVASLSPAAITAGAEAFTLTVNGSGFVSSSTVQWNGSNRSTSFVSATQVTASIAAADIAAPTYVPVAVANPAPGGGTSNSVGITPLWSEPASGASGLLVDASTDLTSLAQLNSFGSPLLAAWNPSPANVVAGPGMQILMFGTPVASCPAGTEGPMSSFPDSVLTSDGYPGHTSAVPVDMRFEPTPMAACSTAAAGDSGPGAVFFDGSKVWFYTASLGNPTNLLMPFSQAGQNGQGANANITNSSVNYRLPYPGSTVQPWASNGRARLATLAQVVNIQAQDATALTQTKQEMSIYVINSACTVSNSTALCQLQYQFSIALVESDIPDWTSTSAYQYPQFFVDPAQGSLPVVDVHLIPAAGVTVTNGPSGLPLFTSRGQPTQHASFASTQFEIEIDFSQFENAIRIVSALTLGQPVGTDTDCAQCVQVFGASWSDPTSWLLLQLTSYHEIYDASRKSGQILGNYSWLYGGAAP